MVSGIRSGGRREFSGGRTLVAVRDGETSRLASAVLGDLGLPVIATGSLPAACRLASGEALHLVILEASLLGDVLPGRMAEASNLLRCPRLLLIEEPHGSILSPQGRELWIPDLIFKPIDPGTFHEAVSEFIPCPAGCGCRWVFE